MFECSKDNIDWMKRLIEVDIGQSVIYNVI